MSARPDIQTGPITGYRTWRILPHQALTGPPSVRLCAFGRYGIPKVWTPREPTRAVCSDFYSNHDAPWFDHECGLWALPTREAALKQLKVFLGTSNVEHAYGWAVGEVALWGRVIEHEQGWRGQYAYPVSADVVCRRPYTALAVADVYGIPIEWNRMRRRKAIRPREGEEPIEAVLNRLRDRTDRLVRELTETPDERYERAMAASAAAAKARCEKAARTLAALPPIEVGRVDVDEALIAFAVACAASGSLNPGAEDVTERYLVRSGYEPPFGLYGENRHMPRAGFISARAKMIHALKRAVGDGLLEGGAPYSPSYSRGRAWFLTSAGIDHVQRLLAELPLIVVERQVWRPGSGTKSMAVDVRGHASDLRPRDPEANPFADEVEAERQRWTADRLTAKKQGRRAYAAWLLERRALPGADRLLRYSDAEIERAVNAANRRHRQAVPLGLVMQELAPGKPSRTESCAVVYRLGQLSTVRRTNKGWQGLGVTKRRAQEAVPA